MQTAHMAWYRTESPPRLVEIQAVEDFMITGVAASADGSQCFVLLWAKVKLSTQPDLSRWYPVVTPARHDSVREQPSPTATIEYRDICGPIKVAFVKGQLQRRVYLKWACDQGNFQVAQFMREIPSSSSTLRQRVATCEMLSLSI